jgi:hypothetical protein
MKRSELYFRCTVCDMAVMLDEPQGMCNYTGRRCEPGGCDCGTESRTVCEPCEKYEDDCVAAEALGHG